MKIYINNFCGIVCWPTGINTTPQFLLIAQLSFNRTLDFFNRASFNPCLSSSVAAVHNRCMLYKITTSDIWSYHKCASGHFFETKIIFADIGIRFSRPHNFISGFYLINSWNGYMVPPLLPDHHHQIHFIWNDLMTMIWWKRSKHVVVWTVHKIQHKKQDMSTDRTGFIKVVLCNTLLCHILRHIIQLSLCVF
jgi:hypothetical protein